MAVAQVRLQLWMQSLPDQGEEAAAVAGLAAAVVKSQVCYWCWVRSQSGSQAKPETAIWEGAELRKRGVHTLAPPASLDTLVDSMPAMHQPR